MKTTAACLLACALSLSAAERTTISLDGEWEIADSKEDVRPSAFAHRVPVPGLVHSSVPAFPQVDEFDSRQVIQNRVSKGMLPKSALVSNAGVSRQDRNWFWYRRAFQVDAKRAVAVLRINKAQFGAAVWVNGTKIGEHLPCFSAAVFDVSKAIRQGAERNRGAGGRASGRAAGDRHGGHRFREEPLDAGHLRQRVAGAQR